MSFRQRMVLRSSKLLSGLCPKMVRHLADLPKFENGKPRPLVWDRDKKKLRDRVYECGHPNRARMRTTYAENQRPQ